MTIETNLKLDLRFQHLPALGLSGVPQEGFVDLFLASVPGQKSPLDAKSMLSGVSIGKSPKKMTKWLWVKTLSPLVNPKS